jgi:hypothetical protein
MELNNSSRDTRTVNALDSRLHDDIRELVSRNITTDGNCVAACSFDLLDDLLRLR